MALKAASRCVLVQPSDAKNNEHETRFNVIGEHHVVPAQHILAFEDDE